MSNVNDDLDDLFELSDDEQQVSASTPQETEVTQPTQIPDHNAGLNDLFESSDEEPSRVVQSSTTRKDFGVDDDDEDSSDDENARPKVQIKQSNIYTDDEEEEEEEMEKESKKKKKSRQDKGTPKSSSIESTSQYDSMDSDIPITTGPTALGKTEHVVIPTGIHYSSDEKVSLVSLPTYLAIDDQPYDKDTFNANEFVNTMSATKASTTKGIDGVIRWRRVAAADGTKTIESNARFIRWPDGLVQLQVGAEVFNVSAAQMSTTKPTYIYTEDEEKTLRVLATPYERMKLINANPSKSILNSIFVKNTSSAMNASTSHVKHTVSVFKPSQQLSVGGKTMRDRKTAERKLEKAKIEQKYNDAVQSSLGYYEDDDDDMLLSSRKKKEKKVTKHGYESNDFLVSDEDNESSDDNRKSNKSKRSSKKARKRSRDEFSDEEDEFSDGFITDDEEEEDLDEDEEEEEEEEVSKSKKKKSKKDKKDKKDKKEKKSKKERKEKKRKYNDYSD